MLFGFLDSSVYIYQRNDLNPCTCNKWYYSGPSLQKLGCSGVAFVVPRNVFMKSTVCLEGFVCIGKPPHGMPRILCTTDSVKWNLKPFLSSILQEVGLNCIPSHSNKSSNMQSHEIWSKESNPSLRTINLWSSFSSDKNLISRLIWFFSVTWWTEGMN